METKHQVVDVKTTIDTKMTTSAEMAALGGLNELSSVSGHVLQQNKEQQTDEEASRRVGAREVVQERETLLWTSLARVSPKKRKLSNEESPKKRQKKLDASPSIGSPHKSEILILFLETTTQDSLLYTRLTK